MEKKRNVTVTYNLLQMYLTSFSKLAFLVYFLGVVSAGSQGAGGAGASRASVVAGPTSYTHIQFTTPTIVATIEDRSSASFN